MQSLKGILLKTLLPIAIGLIVICWLFAKEFNWSDFTYISWSLHTFIAVGLALLAVCGREIGLIWRFYILGSGHLSLKSSLRVTLLCEFISAITPTSSGGSALSMFFMNKEGVAGGRATMITLTTFLLDEAFFVIMCPLIFIFVGKTLLFGFAPNTIESGIEVMYWIIWGVIVIITILLFLGILINPNFIGLLLRKFFSIWKLKKWLPKIDTISKDIIVTSNEIKCQSFQWWFKASLATIISWVSRFLVVNALFYAFAPFVSQLVVFARQTVVWTLLTVSPTPGGSGISEWLFTTYYGDLLGDISIALIIAVCWRILTYYIYLGVGIFLIPSWLKKKNKTNV